MKRKLIKLLGGYTSAEYWDLHLKFGELQENHRVTIDRLHSLIEKITMRRDLVESGSSDRSSKELPEKPIQLSSTPWSKRRTQLEREDHLRHVESIKDRFKGKTEDVAETPAR